MLKRNKLAQSIQAAALVTGGLMATVAVAQEPVVEEISVTGIRGSLQDALNNKRNANQVVDSVSAEDVGKMPDKNIAESLARIPGVAVSREFGEGEKVSIRGAGPDFNRTLLNGQSVATADWFILDNPSRSFNYTLLPSVLISSLEVYKTPTASMDEGSLGGTVNVKTNRPLDLDANSVALSIEGAYSETSDTVDPQLAAQYSWKNDDETLGVLVGVVKQDRTVERTGFEVLGWAEDAGTGVYYPTIMGSPQFKQDRERETLFGSAQIRLADDHTLTLDALYSKMDSDNQNANWLIFSGDNAADHIANGTVKSNSVVAGDATGTGRGVVNWINRVSSTETNSVTLNYEWVNDNFVLDAAVGHTNAKGGTYRETSWEYGFTGRDYQFDLGKPYLNTNPAPSDAAQYGAGWIWGGEKPTTDEETYMQVDFEMPIEAGAFTAIKTGVKIRQAERTQDRAVYSWHAPNTGSQGGSYLYDDIFAQCPTLDSCGLNGGVVSIDSPASGNSTTVIDQNRSAMESIAFGGINGVPADYATSLELANIWEVEEDIVSLYVQGDFEGDNYRGNVGIRYVQTSQTSGGYEYSADSWGFKTIGKHAGWLDPSYLAWQTEDNDYAEFLPSFNIAFDLTDDQILRFGAARVMARQNWTDLSAYETYGALNVSDPRGQSGNPGLKPFIADQFDVTWEWYFTDESLLQVAAFTKDNKTYRTESEYVKNVYDQQAQQDVAVTFTRPENGLGGSVNGMEFIVQHNIGDFGVQANYTYTDTNEDDASSPGVAGISRHMANIMGYFENDMFGARVMYNYRTDWYKGKHFNGNDLYNDEYAQLDASFSWYVNDWLTLTAEAINLTDEQVVEYSTYEDRLMSVFENGRRFTVGARVNF
jgi:iron complex outermembrane receptor protein